MFIPLGTDGIFLSPGSRRLGNNIVDEESALETRPARVCLSLALSPLAGNNNSPWEEIRMFGLLLPRLTWGSWGVCPESSLIFRRRRPNILKMRDASWGAKGSLRKSENNCTYYCFLVIFFTRLSCSPRKRTEGKRTNPFSAHNSLVILGSSFRHIFGRKSTKKIYSNCYTY